jgi:hypothetical protein
MIAGYPVTSQEHAGGLLNLRIALGGASLVTFARSLAKLDGVRVTTGPEAGGAQRCFLVHCAGFKVVLSAPSEPADHAVALVSRSSQTALALMSELDVLLERLMVQPPAVPEAPQPAPVRRSGLRQGAPLARKTELKRKTPLARGQGDWRR